MFIDCHAHAFAEKIADKAVNQLIDYYGIPTTHGGRLADLLAAGAEAGLDAVVVLVAATRPEQVRPANDWILDLAGKPRARLAEEYGLPGVPAIVPFGTFHHRDPDWRREIGRLRAAGIKGIKLHPEFQGIDLADPDLDEFWRTARDDFAVLLHVGDLEARPDNLSTPGKVAALLDRYPGLRLIAAHMGGYRFWQEALTVLAGRDLYLDTSSCLPYIEEGLLREIIARHGTERIVFGSDYPLRSPAEEWRDLAGLPWLEKSDLRLIGGENVRRLLLDL